MTAQAVTPPDTSSWKWHGHALWLVGFRPFFLLAAVTGALFPAVWVAILTGLVPAPTGTSPMQWHAHEMFYGFGFAVLGGFLLTASKNWVKQRGYYGRALQWLVAAWVLERVALWVGGAWPRPLFYGALYLFPASLAAFILYTLLRFRSNDEYSSDNPLFMVGLPAFLVARWLLLDPATFAAGEVVSLALFRLMFIVMLERTLESFTRAIFKQQVHKRAWLTMSIKGLALALLAAPWLPVWLQATFDFALAILFLVQLGTFVTAGALKRIDISIMYIGASFISVHLALQGLSALWPHVWVGAMVTHVFTFGVMGLIIPAMMTRIARGHTGRKVAFDRLDKVMLASMGVGLLARTLVPQLAPSTYTACLWVSSAAWTVTFGIVAVRSAPFLWRPRIDGREH